MSTSKRPSSRKSIGYLPSPDVDPAVSDKENIGGPLAQAEAFASSTVASRSKKSRSKSLGPGGLDALKEDAGNKRKTAALVAPKSILKPTIPLSPLKEIPTRKPTSAGKPSSAPSSPKPKSPAASPSKSPKAKPSPSKEAADVSPFKPTSEIPREPVTAAGAAQQGNAQEEEAAAERQKQRDAIQKQREARRKSLANRRVSFAPEATLHTFDNLEDLQDSTTSSAATNSTRRRSSMSNFGASVGPQDPPSTPPEQADEDIVKESPAHQRDLHQKKRRRRSSGIPPMNFNNPEEALSSSPYSEASASGDAVDGQEADGTLSESASGPDDSPSDLLMDLDNGTGEQQVPRSPTERLRPDQAAVLSPGEAGDVDEDGGQTMELAGNDVTAAFQPWVQQFSKPSQSASRFAATLDQEKLNPFSPAFRAQQERDSGKSSTDSARESGDMSMDITRAIGGIVRSPTKRMMPSQQRALQSAPQDRRRSSGDSSAFDDGTMEFTTAVGGIQPGGAVSQDTASVDENEDLSMEFTSVFGGIQNRRRSGNPGAATKLQLEQDSSDKEADDADMEMTTALGTIHEHPEEHTEQPMDEEETGQMDMTRAVGAIIQMSAPRSSQASPARSSSRKSVTPQARLSTSISETGSPALSAPRGRGRPRKSEATLAVSTPPQGAKTPPKQMTPPPPRPITPGKTPTPNIAMRHPSPKKLFKDEIKHAKASPARRSLANGIGDGIAGANTPTMKVAPKTHTKRRVSGIGFDKEGLGSPSVAALLDRRTSIGERADVFAPQDPESRGVRFQDPRALEAELVKDREEDERRESGQHILQNEADDADAGERDATMTLKDAISSMTPKKGAAKSKGRKSLAVGSARGVLGKRPAELDDDEDDGTPNGLKGREASPVKRIRLQGPPSASETTRRMFRQSLGAITANDRPVTPITASPPKKSASTPSHSGYFKDVENMPSAQKPLPVLGQPGHVEESDPAVNEEEEKISLQDFLNMTSIRFMELNTTKRRHTIAPGAGKGADGGDDWSQQDPAKRFEDSVVAGACTLPMLELYQHSCRELKKYISEGRKIVREIEASTSEENPPLFREYISATPADRSVMDNQFKNMKTHARHLSKGMWYEWRMKLLEGLREVLVGEAEGLSNDGALLEEQERALEASLPRLMQQHEQLRSECEELRMRAEEIANCDQDELAQARQQLVSADQDIRSRRERLAILKQQSQDLSSSIEDAQDAKVEHLQAIREAQRVREEYRGWSGAEVNKIREQVKALEAQHGWSIASASGSRLTMAYDEQLELSFDAAAFLPGAASVDSAKSENAPIRLLYTADQHEHKPKPLTTEKRFFLQLMRAHLHSIVQSQTTVQELLAFVSSTWTQCSALAEEVHRLDIEGITHCDILSDERLSVKTMMLIPNVATKVNVTFEIGAVAQAMAVEVKLKARAEVAYGEQYREDKMRDFLKARIGEAMHGGKGSWADAVRELKKRLVQRGRK